MDFDSISCYNIIIYARLMTAFTSTRVRTQTYVKVPIYINFRVVSDTAGSSINTECLNLHNIIIRTRRSGRSLTSIMIMIIIIIILNLYYKIILLRVYS